jgi:hypothetical protein
LVGVELWAEVRRMKRVDGLSGREISRRTGLHRDTVARLVAAPVPPRYSRKPAGSKLDPFKGWICEQLQADPRIQSQRLRELATELGYDGGKSIFDDYVREVRPRFLVKRTFQRTIYRPGELVQCDLWEPRESIPVGHGQTRRGWVVTAELCWSRVIAGALIFSKETPDILWGLGRCLGRIGALPEKLVRMRQSRTPASADELLNVAASLCAGRAEQLRRDRRGWRGGSASWAVACDWMSLWRLRSGPGWAMRSSLSARTCAMSPSAQGRRSTCARVQTFAPPPRASRTSSRSCSLIPRCSRSRGSGASWIVAACDT